jgi:hypothetical protein
MYLYEKVGLLDVLVKETNDTAAVTDDSHLCPETDNPLAGSSPEAVGGFTGLQTLLRAPAYYLERGSARRRR